MISLIMWLWTSFCPNPYHTISNHGNCQLIHVVATSNSEDEGGDTGGETGSLPPTPPVPPPPPPPPGN